MLYRLLKPLLFALDPEEAHNLILEVAKLAPTLGHLTGASLTESLSLKVGTIHWNSPVGLAAGLDKNAEALDFFDGQGFGAIECGTVTLKPQAGNPRPRMFRYPAEQSLRNAMGFPNQGLAEIFPRLKNYQGKTPLGVNIGKNKDTTPEESIAELSLLFETLEHEASYFVINVSSPNTPGLRALQERTYLSELFSELNARRRGQDLYLKIAPDLEPPKIVELVNLVHEFKLTGIIATNTTIMPERGTGGVSGQLLKEKSRKIRKIILSEKSPAELIAVGGISTIKDLFQLWDDGGKAAQVYTSYIFQGPQLLKDFQMGLMEFNRSQNLTLDQFFALPLEERKYRLKDFL